MPLWCSARQVHATVVVAFYSCDGRVFFAVVVGGVNDVHGKMARLCVTCQGTLDLWPRNVGSWRELTIGCVSLYVALGYGHRGVYVCLRKPAGCTHRVRTVSIVFFLFPAQRPVLRLFSRFFRETRCWIFVWMNAVQ